jgi:hypothetical protein
MLVPGREKNAACKLRRHSHKRKNLPLAQEGASSVHDNRQEVRTERHCLDDLRGKQQSPASPAEK